MTRTLLRPLVATAVVAALAALLALGPAPAASADTFTVTDASDGAVVAPNTLRWAVEQASSDPNPPTIEIEAGLAIDLTCAGGGVLAYANASGHPLTIVGNGATITQTCAGNAVISTVNEDLTIVDTTVAGGSAASVKGGGDVRIEDSIVEGTTAGGGVTAYSGRATIVRSTLRDNVGSAGGGVGAIHVEVHDSTLARNSGNNGGGAWSDQTLAVVNSTITGNTASTSGGGLYAGLNDIDLTYATVVGNTAPLGANVDLDFSAELRGFASLIGEPQGGGADCDLDGGATVTSAGANVTSDSSCGLDGGPSDLPDTDPAVGPLADNGGPTLTRLPQPGSPALDRADCAVAASITTDQRGVSRPQGPACDSGSVEVEVGGGSTSTTTTPGGTAGGTARPAAPVGRTPRFTG